jgi:hypothetical protein
MRTTYDPFRGLEILLLEAEKLVQGLYIVSKSIEMFLNFESSTTSL